MAGLASEKKMLRQSGFCQNARENPRIVRGTRYVRYLGFLSVQGTSAGPSIPPLLPPVGPSDKRGTSLGCTPHIVFGGARYKARMVPTQLLALNSW